MNKKIKFIEKIDGVYIVFDKISKNSVVMNAKNEKDLIRSLAFSGYFKNARIIDTEIYYTGYKIDDTKLIGIGHTCKIDIEKVLKELSIEMENKAEEIKGDKQEVKKAIEKGNIDIEVNKTDNGETKAEIKEE